MPPEFTYQDLLPIGEDKTEYRLISKAGVSSFTADGRQFLKISKEAISELTQVAIKEIAPKADLVLIVGSKNSSNSVRLVEVSLEYGAKAAYLIDFAAEAKEEWLSGVTTVGVSSGASVPEILVKDLLDWLAKRGFADVQVITATEEHLLFSLPVELRKELKAAGK